MWSAGRLCVIFGAILLLLAGVYHILNWEGSLVNMILVLCSLIGFVLLGSMGITGLRRLKEQRKMKLIGIFGTGSSGKTVFIGMLADTIWTEKYPYLSLRATKGLHHIKNVITRLKGEKSPPDWPDITIPFTSETVNFMIAEKRGIGEKIYHIRIDDISGEEFRRFIEPSREEKKPPEKLEHMNRCNGFVIMIDPKMAKSEEFDYMSCMEFLIRTRGLGDKGKFREPFAFVFTKDDEHQIGDPETFARENMHGLYKDYLKRHIPKCKFFTCSGVGKTDPATKKPKPPLQPRGLVEPIVWVMKRMR